MIYTILAILYLVTVVGNYKTLSKEPEVAKAFSTDPKLALFCLVGFAFFWPVVSLVNNFVAVFQK